MYKRVGVPDTFIVDQLAAIRVRMFLTRVTGRDSIAYKS